MATQASDHSLLVVQIVGLILGWAIVHWLSRQRDLEKERRALVYESSAAQTEKVSTILVDARTYHTGNRDEATERKIKMTLQDVAESLNAMSGVVNDPAAIRAALRTVGAFRRAVTGKHFEDEHVGPLSDPDDVLESIALAGLNAKRALIALQHSQYRR